MQIKKKSMQFSIKTSLLKACKYIVIFGLPILVDQFIIQFPEWSQLSLGGLLVLLANFLKVRLGVKLP